MSSSTQSAARRPFKLYGFHGGVHIPDQKSMSSGRPLAEAPLPAELRVPLQQHIGTRAKPCVSVGDRVLKGQLLAEPDGYISAAVHAPSSGLVTAIENRPVPHPSGLSGLCVVIETDGEERWAELPEPMADYAEREPSEVRERIRWAGIVGLGGASFPTSVKLNPGGSSNVSTLILNGAECEPYISCDDALMQSDAERVIQGLVIMRHLLDAEQCLIGIEDNKPKAIAAMREALKASPIADQTRVLSIPTVYPSGGERQLIKILTNREVPAHGIPADIGIVCQNVGTAAAVADAVLEGRPLIERLVTVTGRAIAEPQNLRARIGTPLQLLVEQAGGLAEQPRKLICGGPMMGFELEGLDLPVTKACNCVLALTEKEAPDPGPALACIRCGRCAQACPAYLLPQQLYWHARAKEIDKVQDYNLFDCIECGCCSLVCPSHIPLVQYYRFAKAESWTREQDKRAAEHARRRHEARQERLERLERERKAKQRKKKAEIGGTKGGDVKKSAIEAARKRAAEKKAARAAAGEAPKNTDNLTAEQRAQIAAVDKRRAEARSKGAGLDTKPKRGENSLEPAKNSLEPAKNSLEPTKNSPEPIKTNGDAKL